MKLENEFLQKNGILIYKIILCVLSWITIGYLVIPSLFSATPLVGIGWTVSTYTFQSNFLVFLWITCEVIYIKKEEKPKFLSSIVHGAITLYITVTLVIFALILQPLAGIEGMFEIGNMLYHYIIPILVIIEWVLTHKDEEYEKKMALYWLIYPFIYLGYAMIVELVTGQYIYFFISITEYGALVILFVALLTLFFYGLARLLFYVHDRK